MSDPTLSDVDFKNKMAWVWTTLGAMFAILLKQTQIIDLGDYPRLVDTGLGLLR